MNLIINNGGFNQIQKKSLELVMVLTSISAKSTMAVRKNWIEVAEDLEKEHSKALKKKDS